MNATEGTYAMPDCCEACGSRKIGLRVQIMSNGALSCKYICLDCGHFSKMLPKLENLACRTNTTLANWRKQVWKRDNCRCVICGSREGLNVHHIIPVSVSEKYKYVPGNGVTLCETCHRLAHISKYDIHKIGGQSNA